MFKARIKRWGLDKKFKEAEVLQMLQLKRQRDAAGKSSSFRLRDQDVEWDRVARYLKRRPDLEERIAGAGAGRSKVAHLVCRTPSPVPRLLQPASETRIQEDILRLLRDHINGSVEGRAWTVSRSDQSLYGRGRRRGFGRVGTWFQVLSVTRHLLAAQRPNAAFAVLNRGLDSMRRLVRDNDPRFFYMTIDQLIKFSGDVQRSLITFISEMHQVVLGHQHPMSLVWRHLGCIIAKSLGQVYERSLECSKSCFGVHCGPGGHMVHWLHVTLLQQSQHRRHQDGEACSRPASDYLRNAVAAITTNEQTASLGKMLVFAKWQMATGHERAAHDTLAQAGLLIQPRLLQNDGKWRKLEAEYYECRSALYYIAGDFEKGLAYDIQRHEIVKRVYGPGSLKTLEIAAGIAQNHNTAGNYKEAAIWTAAVEESVIDGFSNMSLDATT